MNESNNETFWVDLKSGKFASMVAETAKGQSVSNSKEVYNILKPLFAKTDDIEKVYFIFLDSKNNIISIENLFSGTISASAIYTREVVKMAIKLKANAFVMAHNHPSGDVIPSSEDKAITLKVGFAAASIDVSFHDHIIIGDGYCSMADSGWLKDISKEFHKVLNQTNTCCESQKNLSEAINMAIMENELSAIDWELWNLAEELYWWIYLFQAAFFKEHPIPLPALTFEKTRINTLSHYRIGRNDMAIKEQLNLNKLYLTRPLWSVLSTLLHECCHIFEYIYIFEQKRTISWYHSKQFRAKMKNFGILCANNGCHVGLDTNGLFVHILRQHGVSFAEFDVYSTVKGNSVIPLDPAPKKKGKSKLKKWTCGCQIVRVGKREFCATCDICRNRFILDE
jgi:DNA repair protein RadC